MNRRPPVIVVARIAHAIFFLAVSAYCFLAYTPFAYRQFIKPGVVPAISEFVNLSPALFCLVVLISVFTLLPFMQRPNRRISVVAYAVTMAAVGLWAIVRPALAGIADSPRSLLIGLLALAPPIWLAAIDHRVTPAPPVEPIDERRALTASFLAGLLGWATYAVAVPFRIRQTVGIDLSPPAWALALGSSLVADVLVFAAIFLVVQIAVGAARFTRAPARVEYWLLIAALSASLAIVLYGLVCASMAFTGPDAAAASAAIGLAVSAVWAGIGRLRAARDGAQPLDALALFFAPVVGRGVQTRLRTMILVGALPVLAYVLAGAVAHFDWNFLIQKLGVLVVWLLAYAVTHAGTRAYGPRRGGIPVLAAPLVALGLFAGVGASLAAVAPRLPPGLNPQFVLDRFAAVDPSFRLIRDARTVRSGDTARFYAYLKAHTFVSPGGAPRADIDFAQPLTASPGPKPLIFLFIVDSLRRDYVSVYNPAATFTPEIAKLASDSFVFERAFTRYAGTAMAVPSIWAGGMLMHELEHRRFAGRNSLMKLLTADGYQVVMTIDHIAKELVTRGPRLTEMDPQLGTMQVDLCRTVDELAAMLDADQARRPMFVYTLSQNAHIANAASRKLEPGESYPGFFPPVASSIRRLDGCVGRFVEFLKRSRLYDRSIIILTSDHGDSLGEEGRWGHAYFMFPEVMRIPLIIHVPHEMRTRVSADLARVAFSTDITPTLYALLGHDARDLGSLFGSPLFVAPGTDLSARRREPLLLASSYGPVYGMLRQNGRVLYTADAVDAREDAFDLGRSGPGTRLALTAEMTATNRRLIRDQLSALAALNHVTLP